MPISKIFDKMTTIILIILMLWLGLSYTEILIKNTRSNPVYSKGNAIIMVIKWTEVTGNAKLK